MLYCVYYKREKCFENTWNRFPDASTVKEETMTDSKKLDMILCHMQKMDERMEKMEEHMDKIE